MNNLITTSLIALCTISSCSNNKKIANVCNSKKHGVYLYINNLSFKDTLARARLTIDDSIYLDKLMPRSTNQSALYKMVPLCQGPHRLNVRFGRFDKDTILTISAKTSLFIDMNYLELKEPLVLSPNGVRIVTLIRDGGRAID
jgi:hypothetical protein